MRHEEEQLRQGAKITMNNKYQVKVWEFHHATLKRVNTQSGRCTAVIYDKTGFGLERCDLPTSLRTDLEKLNGTKGWVASYVYRTHKHRRFTLAKPSFDAMLLEFHDVARAERLWKLLVQEVTEGRVDHSTLAALKKMGKDPAPFADDYSHVLTVLVGQDLYPLICDLARDAHACGDTGGKMPVMLPVEALADHTNATALIPLPFYKRNVFCAALAMWDSCYQTCYPESLLDGEQQ
jgi:hypothetical protein